MKDAPLRAPKLDMGLIRINAEIAHFEFEIDTYMHYHHQEPRSSVQLPVNSEQSRIDLKLRFCRQMSTSIHPFTQPYYSINGPDTHFFLKTIFLFHTFRALV